MIFQNNSKINSHRRNENSQIRLFCFPFSGASAAIYTPWIEHLPGFIEVCPIQYPGHGNRIGEPLVWDLSGLVNSVILDISCYLDKPFAFFGHSLGALLCYEVARKISISNCKLPEHLFVSAHRAPHLPDTNLPMHQLDDQNFLKKVTQLGGMDESLMQNRELVDIMLPVLRADFAVCETYHYQFASPLNCPITALGGLEDPYVKREELDAWEKQTTLSFSLRMFPGGHFFIRESQYYLLQIIARELNSYSAGII